MITKSGKVLLMDAYLSTRSFDMIKDILGEDVLGTKKGIFLKSTFQNQQREYVDLRQGRFASAA